MTTEERLLLTPEEVGHLLGLGRSMIYQMIRSGEIPSVKVSKTIKVRRTDLVRYIDGLAK